MGCAGGSCGGGGRRRRAFGTQFASPFAFASPVTGQFRPIGKRMGPSRPTDTVSNVEIHAIIRRLLGSGNVLSALGWVNILRDRGETVPVDLQVEIDRAYGARQAPPRILTPEDLRNVKLFDATVQATGARGVDLRSAPSLTAPSVGFFPNGTVVVVHEVRLAEGTMNQGIAPPGTPIPWMGAEWWRVSHQRPQGLQRGFVLAVGSDGTRYFEAPNYDWVTGGQGALSAEPVTGQFRPIGKRTGPSLPPGTSRVATVELIATARRMLAEGKLLAAHGQLQLLRNRGEEIPPDLQAEFDRQWSAKQSGPQPVTATVAVSGFPGLNLRNSPNPSAPLVGSDVRNGAKVRILYVGLAQQGESCSACEWWMVETTDRVWGYVRAVGPAGESNLQPDDPQALARLRMTTPPPSPPPILPFGAIIEPPAQPPRPPPQTGLYAIGDGQFVPVTGQAFRPIGKRMGPSRPTDAVPTAEVHALIRRLIGSGDVLAALGWTNILRERGEMVPADLQAEIDRVYAARQRPVLPAPRELPAMTAAEARDSAYRIFDSFMQAHRSLMETDDEATLFGAHADGALDLSQRPQDSGEQFLHGTLVREGYGAAGGEYPVVLGRIERDTAGKPIRQVHTFAPGVTQSAPRPPVSLWLPVNWVRVRTWNGNRYL